MNTRNAADPPEGFKTTELGPLPEVWRVVRLGEIVSISRKPRKMTLPDTIPFIPMEAIPDDGSLYPSRIEYRSIRDIRSGVYCEGSDILFAKITPSLENGKQAIVSPEIGLAYTTTEVYPLKAKRNEVDSFYLFVLLRAPWVRTHLAEKMEGSTGRQRLAKQVLLNFPIPLPSLAEQRAIAHVLRAISGQATNYFLVNLLNFLDLSVYIRGTTRGKLNQSIMKNIVTPLPPLSEQRKIARIIQTVDRRIEAEENHKQVLEDLFRSLLDHLMTAKFRLPTNFMPTKGGG